MSEIPEDIMKAASAVVDAIPADCREGYEAITLRIVARAILAERERCASLDPMRDYNEPIADNGMVVGDGLVQRIKDLEAQITRLERERDALREALTIANEDARNLAIRLEGESNLVAELSRRLAVEAEITRLRTALAFYANKDDGGTHARAALEAKP